MGKYDDVRGRNVSARARAVLAEEEMKAGAVVRFRHVEVTYANM